MKPLVLEFSLIVVHIQMLVFEMSQEMVKIHVIIVTIDVCLP